MAKIKKNSKNKNRKLQGTPVGKAKYNQKNKVVSKIKKKALGTKIKKAKFDARNVLHAKSRKEMLATDARNKLAKIAKGVDARQKLEKIKNLKEGKFDVKKTKKGGITIVTTTKGQLQLTTKKKELAKNKASGNQVNKDKVSKIGKNLTKSVNSAGKISLSTKKAPTPQSKAALTKNSALKKLKKQPQPTSKSRAGPGRVQAVKQTMSRAARLDGKISTIINFQLYTPTTYF